MTDTASHLRPPRNRRYSPSSPGCSSPPPWRRPRRSSPIRRDRSRRPRRPDGKRTAEVGAAGRQRDFLGYVGRGEEPLAPATQALVEEVKETMQTCSERLEGTRAGKGQRRQPYPRHGQNLSRAFEHPTLLDSPIQQDANRYRAHSVRCRLVKTVSVHFLFSSSRTTAGGQRALRTRLRRDRPSDGRKSIRDRSSRHASNAIHPA